MTIDMNCPHCKGTGRVPPETMGNRVRALREKRGLTAKQVSEMTGGAISAANLGHVETGANINPTLPALRAIAELFGVTVGYLHDGEPK